MSNLTKDQKDELVTSYAALALYDGDSEISSEQLNAFITATGNEVEPYWPMLFSKFLAGKMEDLITSVGGGGALLLLRARRLRHRRLLRRRERRRRRRRRRRMRIWPGGWICSGVGVMATKLLSKSLSLFCMESCHQFAYVAAG
ncbi:ribosomal protein [Nannochloropsis oceanica]